VAVGRQHDYQPSLDAGGSHLCCRNWCSVRQSAVCQWRHLASTGSRLRRKQAARDAGSARTTARPKGLLDVARRGLAVVQVSARPDSAVGGDGRQAMLYFVGHCGLSAYKLRQEEIVPLYHTLTARLGIRSRSAVMTNVVSCPGSLPPSSRICDAHLSGFVPRSFRRRFPRRALSVLCGIARCRAGGVARALWALRLVGALKPSVL
jgi:hypothetical protein